MVILDIVLLICFVPAVVLGISKGFFRQLTELLALILGCLAAVRFTEGLVGWLSRYITLDGKLVYILCFILILIIVAAVLSLIGEALTKLFNAIALGWINRLLGLVFGLVKTAFVMGLVILLFEGINSSLGSPIKPEATKDSVIYNAMKNMAQKVSPSIKNMISEDKPQTAFIEIGNV